MTTAAGLQAIGCRWLAVGFLLLSVEGGGPRKLLADCLDEGENPIAILNIGTAWAIGGQPFTEREVPPGFLGSWLIVRAVLSGFEGCLEGENPPGVEHTMVLDGLNVGDFGLWQDPDTRDGGQVIRYDGGRVRVFRDPSPDAGFLDPASFVDGELVLSGRILSFLVTTGVPRELELSIQFDGDPAIGLPPGHHFQAGGACDFECQPASLPPPLADAGYFALLSGSLVMRATVEVAPATWSSIKRGLAPGIWPGLAPGLAP